MKRSGLWALGLATWLLFGVACGGGGGGPTAPPPPPPTAGVTFTPSGVSGPQTLTLRRSPTSTDQRLVLELVAQEVTTVYGVAFDLRYPTSVLEFDAILEESFLGADGAVDTTLQIAESPAGNLIVGLTRLGRVPGASGSGVLLTLEFRVVGSGDGSLTFIGNEAIDPDGDALTGISWGAGSVSATL